MRLRDVQRAMANVQVYRTFFASLVNETVEYSKKNPAVDPILEGAGIKPKSTMPATPNKPAGK